jgi:hypothetical protein
VFHAFVDGNGSAPFSAAPTPSAAALRLPNTLVPGAGAGAGLGDGDGLGEGDEPAAGAGAGASPPPPPQAANHSAESAISAARRSLLSVMPGIVGAGLAPHV